MNDKVRYFLLRVFSRAKSLKLTNCIPDKLFLEISFFLIRGKKLNLKNPQTFNEKIQWFKLYDRNPMYTKMVDKFEAKNYVTEKIGSEYIIPNLGVWDKFDDIDFDKLPNQFVLKCTHDSGGLVICKDKSKLDIEKARIKIETCLKRNYFYSGREWPYKNVKPRIIAEKFMNDFSSETEGLTDYKFYCFNGEPKFLYISKGLENHSTASISFLTLDWKFADFRRSDYKPYDELPEKPSMFEEMIKIAAELSKDIKFVRVDLYQIDNKIYFSELTFSPCGGIMPFEPEEADYEVGKLINLD